MSQRSCDLCQNPAVIHDTVTRAGVVKVRHLCRAHGLKIWRGALPIADHRSQSKPASAVLQPMMGQPGKGLHRRADARPPEAQ